MRSKPQYRYLVKVSGMKDHYKGCKWQPDFWFLSSTYRNDFGHGVPIEIFMSRKQAAKAIRKEKALLKSELQQFTEDLKLITRTGMTKRYPLLESFLKRQTNQYCFFQDSLEYTIVKVELEKLREVFNAENLG